MHRAEADGIDAMCVMNVNTGKETLKLLDYASSGKQWDKKFEAWLLRE